MPILDLVTPWAAAARADDPVELAAFLDRHRDLLESIRRQRSPTEPTLPPPRDWGDLGSLMADDALHQSLREVHDRLVDRGLTAPRQVALVASAAPGGPVEVIPEPGATTIALFVDRLANAGDAAAPFPSLTLGAGAAQPISPPAATAIGMATLTRWTTPGNPVAAIAARGPWDRWVAAREVPLAEWVYAAGLGVHGALQVTDAPAAAIGVTDGEFRRLRQGERGLRVRLEADLDQPGIGLVMRWLEDHAPAAMRRCPDGTIIPVAAGRYLGWRMLAERVERVGLAEAARMPA